MSNIIYGEWEKRINPHTGVESEYRVVKHDGGFRIESKTELFLFQTPPPINPNEETGILKFKCE